MESHDKEVFFNLYCINCVHKDEPETSFVCEDCLTCPVNEDSHKPIKFKSAED